MPEAKTSPVVEGPPVVTKPQPRSAVGKAQIAQAEAEVGTQVAALEQMSQLLAANPQVLAAAIDKLDTKTLSDLRKRMGAAPVTQKRRRRRNADQDTRSFVKAYGDATHEEGFMPVAPDWVMERDKSNPGFLAHWQEKWLDGKSITGLEMEINEDEIMSTVQM